MTTRVTPFMLQEPVTPWVAYTPTFTGFGTPTGVSFFSRRVGDSLQVRGIFTCGTNTATEARVTLGFNGVNGGVTVASTKTPAGVSLVGDAVRSALTVNQVKILCEPSVDYMTFSAPSPSSNGTTKLNGSALVTNGETIFLNAQFPITGW